MKLTTIKTSDSEKSQFGFIVKDTFFSFESISELANVPKHTFSNINEYLVASTQNLEIAKEYLSAAQNLPAKEGISLNEVKFLPALTQPKAIFDFALTPQHLSNSASTFVKHEYSFPMSILANAVMKKKVKKMQKSKNFSYYIGNTNAISGEGDTLHWPEYTSYLDIEPELAIITGDIKNPIAGYIILNDISARDIQVPELNSLSLTRSKHFSKSNGLSSLMVTPDEIENPLNLKVSVNIGDRFNWEGNTDSYSATPKEVIHYLQSICDLAPGTIIGLGTIPYCCGLDNDLWIEPGEDIHISFEGLGSLRQTIPESVEILEPSRWGKRFNS